MYLKKNKVSIIIPTYNRKKSLVRCLRSIDRQEYKNYEIIVVDDGSTDDIYEHIQSKCKTRVKYVKNAVNKGPNYARNVGIVASDGEYVLFLDSDCEIINKKMIQNMLRAIKTIPNVGALGGYFDKDSKRSISLSRDSFHLVYFGLKNSIDLQRCDIVTSGNLFVKKELLYKFKGFDDFILGSSTEVEFNLFLMENGYKNYFGPSISVKHHKDKEERNNIGIHSKIKNKQIKNTLRLLYAERNYLRFYLKNYGFTVFVHKYMMRLFSITIISLLAFVKQSFFGFKDKKNNQLSVSAKIMQAIFLTVCLVDPFIWNVLNFDQTRKCKNSNFLYNKEN